MLGLFKKKAGRGSEAGDVYKEGKSEESITSKNERFVVDDNGNPNKGDDVIICVCMLKICIHRYARILRQL
jgi:hypothetical protein